LFVCLFSILYVVCFCFVLGVVSPLVHSCLFPIFEQVYRTLPLGGNSISVNMYHIGIMEHAKCKEFGYNHELTSEWS